MTESISLSAEHQIALSDYLSRLSDYLIVLNHTRDNLNQGKLPTDLEGGLLNEAGVKLDTSLQELSRLNLPIQFTNNPSAKPVLLSDAFERVVKEHRQPFLSWYPSAITLEQFTHLLSQTLVALAD